MFNRHHAHWPAGLPKSLSVPRTSIYFNLEVSARRHADHCALDYYGSRTTYGELKRQIERAGVTTFTAITTMFGRLPLKSGPRQRRLMWLLPWP